MNIISNYISKTVLAAIFMVTVALLGLNVVFSIMHEVARIRDDYTFFKALQFVILEIPLGLYSIMPLASMVGCLVGLGALANSSELVVLRSAGISVKRMIWMVLKPAFFIMLLSMLIGEYVAPQAQQMASSLKSVALHDKKILDVKRIVWLRDGDNFVFAQIIHPDGRIQGLSIFEFDENNNLLTVTRAETAHYNIDYWQLEKVEITHFNSLSGSTMSAEKQQLPEKRWSSSLKPELLSIAAVSPNSLKMTTLWRYKNYLEKQNLNSIQYELAFWEKIFYPLVMASLVLVGIVFVFGPLREVTMGYRLFWGVLMGVVFNTFQQALGPISIVFGFSPILAMATPVALCFLVGVILLRRVR